MSSSPACCIACSQSCAADPGSAVRRIHRATATLSRALAGCCSACGCAVSRGAWPRHSGARLPAVTLGNLLGGFVLFAVLAHGNAAT
jgi:hypothetical protein